MRHILANRIITPDGTIMQSFSRHDYKEYQDQITKEWYVVDGGLSYFKTTHNIVPATNDHCYDDDPHEKIRSYFHWGTRGKDGTEGLRWVALKDLTSDHICAILETQHQVPDYIRKLFINELKFRAYLL